MSTHSDDHPPSSDQSSAPTGIRLQRFLAATGLGSRRKCEEFIVAGRVSVDGQVVRDLGTRVDAGHQEVRVDSQVVRRDPPRYFVLNKPRGYLCTNNDPAGRPRAIDLVPQGKLRLFTVGRLDESSEGLILLTNDGEMAHRLAHPRFQVARKYIVQVAGRPTQETFEALKEGLYFTEGRFQLHWVRRIGTKGNSTLLEVGLSHGQNREIRRLFARVGHKVMRLRRVAFGPLSLGRLPEGRCRPLTTSELSALREMAAGTGRRRRERKPQDAPERPRREGVAPRRPQQEGTPERRVAGRKPSPRHREELPSRETRPATRPRARAGGNAAAQPVDRERRRDNRVAKPKTARRNSTEPRPSEASSAGRKSRGNRKRRQQHE